MTTVFSTLIFLAVTMTAVSHAWGMRGDLIGGEEGAMLPGALLGLFLARFLLPDAFGEYAFYFVALGISGMFIGGTEPYAQAFQYLYWGDGGVPKAKNMKKGIAALAIKGAPWFGNCAAVVSIGFSALAGKYEAYKLIILVLLLPIVRSLGTFAFNCPMNAEKGVFPKIYFSQTSKEEWGGLWFMLLTFLGFEVINGDKLALIVTVCGMIGGAVGWIISQLIDCATCVRMKNGKYFFGKFQENGRIDNWKIMEFGYGACGSAAIVLGFILCRNAVLSYADSIIAGGSVFNISDNAYRIMFAVWFALFILDNINHFIPEKMLWLKKPIEFLHRPMLCYIPMLFVMLGNMKIALFMSVLILFWQGPEELCFVQLKRRYNITVPTAVSYICLIALTVLLFVVPEIINIKLWYPLICLSYLICAITANIAAYYGKDGMTKNIFKMMHQMGSFISVKLHYMFCIIITSLALLLY